MARNNWLNESARVLDGKSQGHLLDAAASPQFVPGLPTVQPFTGFQTVPARMLSQYGGGGNAVYATTGTDGSVSMSFGGATNAFAMQAMRTGTLQVLDSHLAALYYQNSPFANAMGAFIDNAGQLFGAIQTDAKGHQYAAIEASSKNGNGAALLHQLEAIGLKDGASFGGAAGGLLDVSKVGALLNVANLGHVHESAAMNNTGYVDTQADLTLLAQAARLANFGVDGSGITIGVMSDSFNRSGKGSTAQDKASGDLPSGSLLKVINDTNNGEDEGRAMAQLVHDIAPGAKIVFSGDGNSDVSMAAHIIDLMNAGCKVIVDDITYLDEPAYQDGVISQAIQKFVNAGGIYLTSAANEGRNGFEENSFQLSGATLNGDKLAKMTTGANSQFLSVVIPAGRTVSFILQWDQPSASANSAHGAATDLDLFVLDQTGTTILRSDQSSQIGGDPVSVVQLTNNGSTDGIVNLAVGLGAGTAKAQIGDFKLISLLGGGGQLDIQSSSLNINSGSIFGHAASSAFAVGAVPYFLTPYSELLGGTFVDVLPTLEDFSSSGPTAIFFDAKGNRLAHPIIHSGPDFSSVDGGDTTFFGSDDGIDGDGLPNFYGTSAAAPDAAAIVVLMLQANLDLNRADILALLQDSAWDITQRSSADHESATPLARGFDSDSGSGLINAALAVQYAQTLTIQPTALQTVFVGTHLNDTFAFDNTAILAIDGTAITTGERKLLASDRINGGGGSDTVTLNGDYATHALVFGAKTMVNVEGLKINAGHSYNLTTNNATVAAGATLTLDATALGTHDTVKFNGSAETNGKFILLGGSGADTLIGGSGNDIITGGTGGDTLNGRGGSDIFVYGAAKESASVHFDTVVGFDFSTDKFDLPVAITGVETAITKGSLSTASFDADLTTVLAGHLPIHHAILFTANHGTLAGQTFLIVDTNGHAGYTANADLVIHLTGAVGTLATGDFI